MRKLASLLSRAAVAGGISHWSGLSRSFCCPQEVVIPLLRDIHSLGRKS